jgi:hypothetical protein
MEDHQRGSLRIQKEKAVALAVSRDTEENHEKSQCRQTGNMAEPHVYSFTSAATC